MAAGLTLGMNVVMTGDGSPFRYLALGTVDGMRELPEGSVVHVYSDEVHGYNTRIFFIVPGTDGSFNVGPGGTATLGYVDFKNPTRNVVPEGSLSRTFRPVKDRQ